MQMNLPLFTFYFNGGLHSVSTGKPSKRMSNLRTVQFLKTESEPNFGFPHIPRLKTQQLFNGRLSRERESRFLMAHQNKTGHSVPFEVKIKANRIIR